MMTIVVPTLGMPGAQEMLSENIHNLCDLSFVSRIAIINNSKQEMPIPNHPKTLVFNSPHNLYVNPSWNLGALLARDDNSIMLINDDIIINPIAVEAVNHLLEKEDCLVGCGGISELAQQFSMPNFTQLPAGMPYAFGCCLALRVKSWPIIPNSMLVYFGDNWIVEKFRRSQRGIYMLNAESFRGHVETTSIHFGEFYDGDGRGFAAALMDQNKIIQAW